MVPRIGHRTLVPRTERKKPMRFAIRTLIPCLLSISIFSAPCQLEAADYTPGKFHYYTHADGTVPKGDYQYSVFVPKDYDAKKSYPLVFFLHGGGKGRSHPNQGRRNMVADRLKDNKRTTDAGYSRNMPDSIGYILVSPVKPITRWKAEIFKRLLAHVKTRVSIDENRVYVTGFSMGGQGTWRVACGNDGSYKIAAMMPLGAWGCKEVKRGYTPQSCKTLKTAVWVLHCPRDHVSKISEQIPLFQSHITFGGYGRFTMIPGKGHISRPRNDKEFFSMRMGWMLAQTHGTPFNYVVRVNDGEIVKVASGERPFTGDDSTYGFYEPGTVVNITAPESKGGSSFIKWVSDKGTFAKAASRSTSYTSADGDVSVSAVYGARPYKLIVNGGKADPAEPRLGQIVTVSADGGKFHYWTTSTNLIDLANPCARTFTFAMPSGNVTLAAQTID